MTDKVTAVYLEETGHVLAAATRADQPGGDEVETANQVLTQDGVFVRSLQPPPNKNVPPAAANPIRNQFRAVANPLPITLPTTLLEELGQDPTLSAQLINGDPLPDWLEFHSQTRQFKLTPTPGDKGRHKIRVMWTSHDETSGYTDFDLVLGDDTDPPEPLNRIPDYLGGVGKFFELVVPPDTFFSIQPLTYDARRDDGTPLPSWLAFNPLTHTFSGVPSTGDVGEVQIKLTGKQSTDAADTVFKVTVPSLVVEPNSSLEFLIDDEHLGAVVDDLDSTDNEPSILSQPCAFTVNLDSKKLERLPDPAEWTNLNYSLKADGLHVRLSEPAVVDIPIWALVRRQGDVAAGSGKILKSSQHASIGFTLNPTAKYDVLLLVQGYAPFDHAELAQNELVSWPLAQSP